ncbi:unnamed protein product [Lupinus luteus]|uniref:Calcineurin-like phosphoesterase domain-containing protein n=1 Tax=Lupinus luteus TaxID=3873 RepID=A0AAV1WUD9_LUPLU
MALFSVYFMCVSALLQRLEHPIKPDGSLSLMVIGDWGRKGAYNQSQVATQDLEIALKDSIAKWKIVVGHHPVRSIGHHGNTKELNRHLLPILEANNVDMYINGHDHCLEHISSTRSQIQYLTSGGGSKAWKGDIDDNNTDGVKFYYDGQGFMTLELEQTNAKVVYYDVFGKVLHVLNLFKGLHSPI